MLFTIKYYKVQLGTSPSVSGGVVSTEPTVTEQIEEAHRLLETDRCAESLTLLDDVKAQLGNEVTAEVEHARGIRLRMLGRLTEADDAFEAATHLTADEIHLGRIMRDWGMVRIAAGEPEQAVIFFNTSLHYLKASSCERDSTLRKREYWCSLGFKGWAIFKLGEYKEAALYLRQASVGLAKSKTAADPYELNNYIREMRVASLWRRNVIGKRALRLAKRARSRKRMAYVLLQFLLPPRSLRQLFFRIRRFIRRLLR